MLRRGASGQAPEGTGRRDKSGLGCLKGPACTGGVLLSGCLLACIFPSLEGGYSGRQCSPAGRPGGQGPVSLLRGKVGSESAG